MSTRWTTWNEHAWLQRAEDGAITVQLCDRVLRQAETATSGPDYLAQVLPDIASELTAQWAAVVDRWPGWQIRAEYGRSPFAHLPARFFEEVLDRDAGGLTADSGADGWSLLSVPLTTGSQQQTVLAVAGRRIEADDLARCVAVSRVLATGLLLTEQRGRLTHRNEQLRETLRIAYRLSDIFEMVPLLEALAEEATRLLRCDRASIFIWDRQEQKLLACPALGVEGGTLYLPDDAGIVGAVIQSGQAICVDDAYEDDRFNRAVDRETGYRTKSLLCVPLRDGDGRMIGAFQGINRLDGLFDADDEDILGQLGIQAAIALRNTRERERLIRTHRQLTEQVASRVRLIGESPAMQMTREKIERLAPTDLPVLILGASGTGKEVVAQSLHYHGPRCDEPFVAVNCAALTETLLETELFGHEKGAFTDATSTHKGKFELADGGTVFLDEIGDMSPGGQAKLLRVLEQKVITRVGGSQTIPVNVRIVAATNVNLAQAVRDKRFREDLYFRLNVVTLELPPLAQRPEDIVPLAEFFLRQFCPKSRRPVLELSDDAVRRLKMHPWPGNVRELRNLMERVAFLSSGERVEEDDLAFVLSPLSDEQQMESGVDFGLSEATTRFQTRYIQRAIARSGGNLSEAARMLELHRSNLHRKMKQLGMTIPDDH